MTVTVIRGNVEHYIPGPFDLQKFGAGDVLRISGNPSDMEKSTWGFAIGVFILRGGHALS